MQAPKYVVLEKKRGETPLEALGVWQTEHPVWASLPASYAGRLDPMAEGKLLVLLGDECKKQESYTKLDKEYVVEVLLDVGSDTGDILGLVGGSVKETLPERAAVQAVLSKQRGTHTIPYPAYSSKTVTGKPLFLHALEGTLDTISIPTHEETIYSISLEEIRTISNGDLLKYIRTALSVVPHSDEASKALGADFRIHAVRNSWNALFLQEERRYAILTIRVACASGTYMRSLAERIGTAFTTRALALSIRRTRIGRRYLVLGFPFWKEF